jgi:hypothetical protein
MLRHSKHKGKGQWRCAFRPSPRLCFKYRTAAPAFNRLTKFLKLRKSLSNLGVAAACAEALEAAGLSAHTAQALTTGPVSASIPNAFIYTTYTDAALLFSTCPDHTPGGIPLINP